MDTITILKWCFNIASKVKGEIDEKSKEYMKNGSSKDEAYTQSLFDFSIIDLDEYTNIMNAIDN